MSSGLPTQSAQAFVRRRRALAERLGRPALLFSGVPRPCNYPANVYPFRPDSHFLYLTGAWLDGAAVLVDGHRDVLFMAPPDPDDLIWHGESPSWSEIQAATGVSAVRDIAELSDELGARELATLPAVDAATRFHQGKLLSRSWAAPGTRVELDEADAALGDAMVALRLIHDEAALDVVV